MEPIREDRQARLLAVKVLGTPTAVLVDALWAAGLRPLRGQSGPMVWISARTVA